MKKILSVFVKKECANFYEGACVFKDVCIVLNGAPCRYFERAVLGPADYGYRLPGYDYAGISHEYRNVTKAEIRTALQRTCECGRILQKRQRMCEKCKIKKRKETYRKKRLAGLSKRHS